LICSNGINSSTANSQRAKAKGGGGSGGGGRGGGGGGGGGWHASPCLKSPKPEARGLKRMEGGTTMPPQGSAPRGRQPLFCFLLCWDLRRKS
jgi:hypothetical protein